MLDAKGTASDTEMPRMDYGQDHAGEEAKIWRGQGARSRTPSSWLKGTGFKPKPTGSYVNLVVPCYLRATTLGLCHCPSAFLLSLHLLWHLSLPLQFSLSLFHTHTRTLPLCLEIPTPEVEHLEGPRGLSLPAPLTAVPGCSCCPQATVPACQKAVFLPL